jgi:hypothetical protein
MTKGCGINLLIFVLLSLHCNSQCLPAFPYKDGWLGGDNGLSVKLSHNRFLWIFSDTFIGPVDSKDRSLSVIIANSTAIASCTDDQLTIQYFWKKDDAGKPLPIFHSDDKNVKYWPTDIFGYNNNLYVVLHKVGLKEGSDADDLFNFSLIGITLAEIRNYKKTDPNEWEIKYFDWPEIFNPNEWNGATSVDDRYLYAFIGRQSQKYNLIRLPLERLTFPEHAYEYLSDQQMWSSGPLRKEDAHVLIQGTIGGSVYYHKDIGKWIMVYGPNFLSSEIQLRFSSDISGIWSEPVTLYIPPEQQDGHIKNDSTYFCYCAREHYWFYDSDRKEMLITYDCNSSSLEKLISDMNIYSPRILRINIAKALSNH